MPGMVDDISQKITRHITQQTQLCQAQQESLRAEVTRLTDVVRGVASAEDVKALKEEMETLKLDLINVRLALAVQSVKIGVWAAIGASIPTVALGILFLLSNRGG